MRILAIDHGTKRMGVAISDELRMIAQPLEFIRAEPFAKFQAWAATVPHTLRNPLYHWTHLELKRYFGIDELLDEESAARIWKKANAQLATPGPADEPAASCWVFHGLRVTPPNH